MKILDTFMVYSHVLVWGTVFALLPSHRAFAQSPLNEQTLQSIGAQSSVEEKSFVTEWIKSAVTKNGRSATASELAAVLADNQSLKTYAREIRMLGRQVEPEFTQNVLARIESASDPVVRGALFSLLRESSAEIADSIRKWLMDTRPAEDLVAESEKLSKLRESIGNGAVALRVCDIAFNVMQEISAGPVTGNSRVRIDRSQSIETRDSHIRLASGTTPEDRPDGQKSKRPEAIVPRSTQTTEEKPASALPSEKPTSFRSWGIIGLLVLVVFGLLGFLLKRRS